MVSFSAGGYPIRFQRQKPIGDYIVDFYCARAGLVVELDGPYHGIDRQMEDDAAALMEYMEAHGGDMPYGDKSSAEEIKEVFGMSKAAFKRALGRLYKEGKLNKNPP